MPRSPSQKGSFAPSLKDSADILTAACELVAEEGLSGLSLRRLAERSGVSVSLLTTQFGARKDVLIALNAQASSADMSAFAPWIERFELGPTLSRTFAAEFAVEILETLAVQERGRSLLFLEFLQASLWDAEIREAFTPWFSARAKFWNGFGASAGLPQDLLKSGFFIGYLIDELAFSLVLAGNPAYRLLRRIGLGRLFCGFAAARAEPDDALLYMRLFDDLNNGADAPMAAHKTEIIQGWRLDAARTCATLMTTQGVSALTHRSVALEAGVAHTTLSYHLPTKEDLVVAGLDFIISHLLTAVAEGEYKAANSAAAPQASAGPDIGRATFAVALAAARMPRLAACAADMRRRRGINLIRILEQRSMTGIGLDALSAQAISLGLIGLRNAAALLPGPAPGLEPALGTCLAWARQGVAAAGET